MALEELRERLATEWQQTVDKLQDSRLYTELKDRYENLTPVQQKLLLIGVITTGLLFVGSIPYSSYSMSEDSMIEFADKRQLIRDLLKTSKEAKESPEIPLPPDVESLREMAEQRLTAAQLLPEQIGAVTAEGAMGGIVNAQLVSGIMRVAANELNLRQLVSLGQEFSNFSPAAKLKDVQIQASAKETGYFDVVYKILVLKVKAREVPVDDEKPKGKKGKK